MTIRTKIRIAWEQNKEIEVTWGSKPYTCKAIVEQYDMENVLFYFECPEETQQKRQEIRWGRIQDIRFVDEEVGGHNDEWFAEKIKQADAEDNIKNSIVNLEAACEVMNENLKLTEENAELRERLTVLEAKEEPEERRAGGCSQDDCPLHAKCLYKVAENCVYRQKLEQVYLEYQPIEEEPDKPHDIASERWAWVPVGDGERLLRTDGIYNGVDVSSSAQKRLQAAAPEIAHAARDLIVDFFGDGVVTNPKVRLLYDVLLRAGAITPALWDMVRIPRLDDPEQENPESILTSQDLLRNEV